MKITIDPAALADAAAWAAQALPKRPAVPVLAGMRLDAADGQLTVSAFDYETSATATASAEVEEPGALLLPGRLLATITASLPDRPVAITSDGSRASLKCGPASFTLLTMPAEEYPVLPEMPPPAGTIGSVAFAEAAAQATPAAGRDDTLPALTGAHIEAGRDRLILVCTDRYRLAVREVAWEGTSLEDATALVPARALAAAAKAMTGGDVVTISLGEGMAGFAGGGKTLVTRQIGGEFPRYATLLPKEAGSTATVDSAALAEAVKRAALVAERNTAVRLAFTPGTLTLRAGTGDEAGSEETVAAGWDEGEFAIAFNPAYLLDGLGAIGDGEMNFAFTGPGKPALLTGKTAPDEEPAYRYLLMPIRLGS